MLKLNSNYHDNSLRERAYLKTTQNLDLNEAVWNIVHRTDAKMNFQSRALTVP